MKPSPLPIVILVLVVAAILWWFWPRDKPAQAGSESAKQLATAPGQAPKSESTLPAAPASGTDASGSSSAAGVASSASTGSASSVPAGSVAGASGASTGSAPAAAAASASSTASAAAASGASATAGSASPAAPAASAPRAAEPLTVVVYFDFDRSTLKSGEAPKLDAFLARLKDRKYTRLNAVGHADRIGEAPHNDQLSKKRADAVVAYLASKGADAARNRTDAKGESQSATGDACKNMGPESASNARLVDCLAKDRRVEIALAD